MKTSLVSTAVLAISSLTSAAAALDKLHRMRSNQSNYQRQQQNQLQDTSYNEEKNDAYIGLLAQEEEDRDIKRRMQVDSSMSMSGTCSFCSGGLNNPDFELPTGDGTTCATASAFAGSLPSSDSQCSTVQLAESICCPPSPTTTEAPPPETTEAPPDTPAPPTDGQCSCSPLEYTFILNLDSNCDVDDLEGTDGIGLTFCFLGVSSDLGSDSRTHKSGIEVHQTIEFVDEDMSNELTPEMLVPLAEEIEIISIQFLEFDTSGELIVINQDDSLSDVTLPNGSEVTFESVSNNLDSGTPIGDQLDFLPGGVQVTLRGRMTDDATGDSLIVSNRITWSYTNACDVQPLEVGESIGWISAGDLIPASPDFCPAVPPPETTTEAPPPETTEAPPATTEAPPVTTEAPLTSKSSKSKETTKSGKESSAKANDKETSKNPMAKATADSIMPVKSSLEAAKVFKTKSSKAKSVKL